MSGDTSLLTQQLSGLGLGSDDGTKISRLVLQYYDHGRCHTMVWAVFGPDAKLMLFMHMHTTQHVWSSGFLCCGSDGIELASTLTPGPCSEYQRLQIGSENIFLRHKGAISALEALRDALYKLTTTTTMQITKLWFIACVKTLISTFKVSYNNYDYNKTLSFDSCVTIITVWTPVVLAIINII